MLEDFALQLCQHEVKIYLDKLQSFNLISFFIITIFSHALHNISREVFFSTAAVRMVRLLGLWLCFKLILRLLNRKEF